MSNLAENLKRFRKARGLTQEKLARLADLTNNTIIKIETGKNQNPTLDTLKSISKALGVSVDELIK
jgi:transcriptional regulator with XRE-family HTH domain